MVLRDVPVDVVGHLVLLVCGRSDFLGGVADRVHRDAALIETVARLLDALHAGLRHLEAALHLQDDFLVRRARSSNRLSISPVASPSEAGHRASCFRLLVASAMPRLFPDRDASRKSRLPLQSPDLFSLYHQSVVTRAAFCRSWSK
jgi:hypothetical protein